MSCSYCRDTRCCPGQPMMWIGGRKRWIGEHNSRSWMPHSLQKWHRQWKALPPQSHQTRRAWRRCGVAQATAPAFYTEPDLWCLQQGGLDERECVNQSGGVSPLMGWYGGLSPAPTGGRSWSSEVWTCIPGLRTVFLLWGHTASLWPPRPASLHPGPGLARHRHHVRTAWHVDTPEGETAQRNRPGVPTWARSERSLLRKSSRSQRHLQQPQRQSFAFYLETQWSRPAADAPGPPCRCLLDFVQSARNLALRHWSLLHRYYCSDNSRVRKPENLMCSFNRAISIIDNRVASLSNERNHLATRKIIKMISGNWMTNNQETVGCWFPQWLAVFVCPCINQAGVFFCIIGSLTS